MRKLSIIGIGAGNPDYLTVQAINALKTLDVVFLIDKGSEKSALTALRTEICERYIANKAFRIVAAEDPARDRSPRDYESAVADWHAKRAAIYERMIREELADGQHGAFLVWGDPCLYDSTLRIVDQVAAMGTVAFEVEVIPGITSIQALAARHKIPINRIGEPVLITTGRKLAERQSRDAVVMLDGGSAFTTVEDEDVEIFWGAYLGTGDEILASGPLRECTDEIQKIKTDARARHGWIMDTYLLRKTVAS
ncbi:precorrin-6A synthase (deacetylating) [Phreatobacter oligotrophus]|jgi:precorrin-6A synthase|uniref:Precorrin-6A synthase [deacetylating] n=1 Tax=Phreatobacter oligotrophus TaxID=1122261 RepID=A0A2T4YWW9_9HYPH|nr:precorrin-6A synthase (deacetylating) [Phreatobacter oligotrophus]PTM49098.1 precorrin-6A synthase (deacetylating) [Phreatobacter oligotrophus]